MGAGDKRILSRDADADEHERILCPTLGDVTLAHGVLRSVGTLNISQFKLLFVSATEEIWIPYPLVDLLTWKGATDIGVTILLKCRDFNVYYLGIPRELDAIAVYQSLVNLLPVAPQDLEAIATVHPGAELLDPGWNLYNARAEYERMGVGTKATQWRIATVNQDYSLCDTYPSTIAVPAECTDEMLLAAAKFRSRGRIPILSYVHADNMGSITRCSQPLAGINQKRNADDEALVDAIFRSTVAFRAAPAPAGGAAPASLSKGVAGRGAAANGRTRRQVANLIVDARPRANAYANAAMGKGFESTENYLNCRREFLGIENIHVMRDSLGAMLDAAHQPNLSVPAWHAALEASGWLKHIHTILEATSRLVTLVATEGANLLVHCSDGWDRTAQLTCMTMLCLDPYYRTIKGFLVLIEKEWLACGHKFAHRLGHLIHPYARITVSAAAAAALPSPGGSTVSLPTASSSSSSSSLPVGAGAGPGAAASTVSVAPPASDKHANEISPVFLQFLDCVWQLLRQHPTQFEFTGCFLRELYRLAHSGDTGTFLFNCERERRALVRQTPSAWTVLLKRVESPEERPRLVNPRYAPRPHSRVLHVATSAAAIRFWRAMYCPNEGPELHRRAARALALAVPPPMPPAGAEVGGARDVLAAAPPGLRLPLWEALGFPGPSMMDEQDDPTLVPAAAELARLQQRVAWARQWLASHGAAAAAAAAGGEGGEGKGDAESDELAGEGDQLEEDVEEDEAGGPPRGPAPTTDRTDADPETPSAPLQIPLGQEARDEEEARRMAELDPSTLRALGGLAVDEDGQLLDD